MQQNAISPIHIEYMWYPPCGLLLSKSPRTYRRVVERVIPLHPPAVQRNLPLWTLLLMVFQLLHSLMASGLKDLETSTDEPLQALSPNLYAFKPHVGQISPRGAGTACGAFSAFATGGGGAGGGTGAGNSGRRCRCSSSIVRPASASPR